MEGINQIGRRVSMGVAAACVLAITVCIFLGLYTAGKTGLGEKVAEGDLVLVYTIGEYVSDGEMEQAVCDFVLYNYGSQTVTDWMVALDCTGEDVQVGGAYACTLSNEGTILQVTGTDESIAPVASEGEEYGASAHFGFTLYVPAGSDFTFRSISLVE